MGCAPKPSPAYRGWPRRGRVWKGPSTIYRTARKEIRPHIRHAKRRDTFSPARRLFSRTVTPYFYSSTLPPARLWACHLPLRGRQEIVQTVSPYRPSSGPFGATFPQGKASLRRVGTLLRRPTIHPLSLPAGQTAPPTQGSLTPRRGFYRLRKAYTRSPQRRQGVPASLRGRFLLFRFHSSYSCRKKSMMRR